MKPPADSWPRGLVAGALLAVVLILPVFVLMLFDAAAGTPRVFPDASGRFALFQRPVQKRAEGEFFGGKLGVEAVLSQRFAILPRHSPPTAREAADRWADRQPPETARATMLRLELENRSAETLEVEIVRVDSALGAFTRDPDRVILAPHQTATIDSLVTAQKICSGGIPLAVALKNASSVETRKLVLNNLTIAKN